MGLNNTPSSNRCHIGLFGRTNVGKSSLINAITNQQLAIVSSVKGTTTDPVTKTMEILPIGPVVMIDTPGLNDDGILGDERINKTREVLRKTDICIVVTDGEYITELENSLIDDIERRGIPYILVVNKADDMDDAIKAEISEDAIFKSHGILVSAINKSNIEELKNRLGSIANDSSNTKQLLGDIISKEDMVVLVTPIDEAAPKGRLILPQQQTIRDILDSSAMCVVTKETELKAALDSLKNPPKMVVTDSQAFKVVNEIVEDDIMLTSFSILFSRLKGDLRYQVESAIKIDSLEDGDKILISEGCTHHRQCGDIGTDKLPKLIRKYTNKDVVIDFTSGGEFPEKLEEYKLIIHCGGCMLNEKEMGYRVNSAKEQNKAMTNYGVAIAYMNGILERAVKVFPDIYELMKCK